MEPLGVLRNMFAPLERGRGIGRRGFGLPASVLVHVALVGLMLALPFLGTTELPALAEGIRTSLVLPPAAAAPPLPKGVEGSRTTRRTLRLTRVEPHQESDPLELPPEVPPDHAPPDSQSGDPAGSERGTSDGLPGGTDGGIPGGDPLGKVGGCPGCTGDGPVTDWDQGPRLLRQTRPVYPQEAFVKKIEGTVVLEILIDPRGDVIATRVLKPLAPTLDQAAKDAALQWKFAPAVRKGKPVAVWAQAPVSFKIY